MVLRQPAGCLQHLAQVDLSYRLFSRLKWGTYARILALNLPFRILGTTARTRPAMPAYDCCFSHFFSLLRTGLNNAVLHPTLDFCGYRLCGTLSLPFLLRFPKHLVSSVETPQAPVQGHHRWSPPTPPPLTLELISASFGLRCNWHNALS